jgi:hypothetical protein
VKIDRATYSIAEVLELVADTQGVADPTPHIPPVPFPMRRDWFGLNEWDARAAFSPVWFADYDHRYTPNTVGAAFIPCERLDGRIVAEGPGERDWRPAMSAADLARKRIRDVALVRLCNMAAAGTIRPMRHGVYIQWNTEIALRELRDGYGEPMTITGDDFRKLCAEIPVVVEAPTNRAGNLLKRNALISAHVREWPTIERDLRDASANGLSARAKDGKPGYWSEDEALAWAKERGKLLSAAIPGASARRVNKLGDW